MTLISSMPGALPRRVVAGVVASGVVGPFLAGCGGPVPRVGSTSASPSAFESVKQALLELRQVHATGGITNVSSTSITPDGRDPAWLVQVAVPDAGVFRYYRIVAGHPRDEGAHGTMSGGTPPFIAALADQSLPDWIDSPRAVDLADGAGLLAYRRRTGVSLKSMMLFINRDRVPIWFVGYSKTDRPEGATAEVDARTGQVLLYEEAGAVKMRATPSAGSGPR